MKAIFINGSPRKNKNTFEALSSAESGAKDAGFETKLIHLQDYQLSGCISCYACKLKNPRTDGVCSQKDALLPLLQEIKDADALVIGSPVYWGCLSAKTNALFERLLYPVLNYELDQNGKSTRNISKEKKTGIILTMNAPQSALDSDSYTAIFRSRAANLGTMLGSGPESCQLLYICNTYQFDDYSRYYAPKVDVAAKAKQRKEQFPLDLEAAYQMGYHLK